MLTNTFKEKHKELLNEIAKLQSLSETISGKYDTLTFLFLTIGANGLLFSLMSLIYLYGFVFGSGPISSFVFPMFIAFTSFYSVRLIDQKGTKLEKILDENKELFVSYLNDDFLADLWHLGKSEDGDGVFDGSFKEFLQKIENGSTGVVKLINHFNYLLKLSMESKVESNVLKRIKRFEKIKGADNEIEKESFNI